MKNWTSSQFWFSFGSYAIFVTQNRRVLHKSPTRLCRHGENNFLRSTGMINFPEKLARMLDTRNEVCGWKCFYIKLKETEDVSRVTAQYTEGSKARRACTRSSFPETRVWYWVTSAKQSSGYFIEPSEYITRLRVHFYPPPPSQGFLRSPLSIRWIYGRLRGYIDRKPRCSMHACRG